MEHYEDPILPPEGDGHGKGFFESANLNIDELRSYVESTVYESESDVVEDLSKRYGMNRRVSDSEIKMDMTREFKRVDISDMFKRIMKGEQLPDMDGEATSGEEPKEVLHSKIRTIDGQAFDLKVYEVMSNDRTQLEYVLSRE